MVWNDVINQRRVKEVLSRGVANNRVAHAYLFYGPEGVGKRAIALAYAQVLQCQEGGSTACGICDACRKVQRMMHPDIHLLFPFPGDSEPQDITERIQYLGQHPYAPIDYQRRPSLSDTTKVSNKQSIYTVKRINGTLRRAMSFRPVEGAYKIAILTDADLMRPEAANAFLKLLEEPSPATVFILITSRPDRMLPTITSRCQRLRFDPLSASDIEEALGKQPGDHVEDISVIARMANGSFTRALELIENEDLSSSRQLVLDYFRYAYTRHADKMADVIEQMNMLGRERVKGVMQLMLSWIRDLMLYSTLQSEELLINIDQAESIRKFCANVPLADTTVMAKLVEQAVELVGRNVQVSLVLLVLADSLHRAMHGKADVTLYTPLHEAESMYS